jgi:iron complex outermembrane receptor protein
LIGIDRVLQSYDVAVTHYFSDSLTLTVNGYVKNVEVKEYFDADGTGLRIQDAFFETNADLPGFGACLVYTPDGPFAGFIGFSSTKDESNLPFVQLVDPVLRGALDAKLAEIEVQFPNVSLIIDVRTDATIEETAAVRQLLIASFFNADRTPISDPSTSTKTINGPFVFKGNLDINSFVVEGTYELTDDLAITVGLRYIDETRFSKDTFFSTFSASAGEDFTVTLPRVCLNYNYSNNMSIYFSYAEGRRSPVVDANAFGENSIVEGETVDSYDIGLKYYANDLSFTATLFAYTYQNFQQSFTDNQTLESQTVSVGDSNMFGFESPIDYVFDDSLRVVVNLGLLDAEFDKKYKCWFKV